MESLAGWGNFRPALCRVWRPRSHEELDSALIQARPHTWIARGLGRSYGDSAVNDRGAVVDLTGIRGIGECSDGRVRVRAGTSLAEILNAIIPLGYFLPVVPGSQYVTVGGAIAADIHGKNHHVDGSFSAFVEEIVLHAPTGERIVCGPTTEAEIFWGTVGGMGLTGAIEEATLRLLPIETTLIEVETTQTMNLDETLAIVQKTAEQYRYSVSWIDALATGRSMGRGWVLAGDHVSRSSLPQRLQRESLQMPTRRRRSVPFPLPNFVLSRWSCRLFNERVYRRGVVQGPLVDLDQFFFPLDHVDRWNRIYGKRGFIQYQALFPPEQARLGITQLLESIQSSPHPAFFAGIKSTGPGNEGMLSFPSPGMTIGVDIPAAPGIAQCVARLDEIVLKSGGRVYLAKDSLLTAESFQAMYPRWRELVELRRRLDPNDNLRSDQSKRLGLT